METVEVGEKLDAEHGVICSMPGDHFGYFGWPSVGRLEDGTLLAGASGMRTNHVCPHGRTTIFISRDDGETWSSPRVINDTPLDDRDVGVTPLGGRKLLISWFSSDHRQRLAESDDPGLAERWQAGLSWVTDENAARFVGSWVRTSADGGDSWDEPVRVPVTTPHGPVRLADGGLVYLGKIFGQTMEDLYAGQQGIQAIRSSDEGRTWSELGRVPLAEGTDVGDYHEPHFAELPSGKLVGMIRFHGGEALGLDGRIMMQTESTDGGETWTEAEPLPFHAVPPHVLCHSSGRLVVTYGYRQEPYGQRVAISEDEGQTWRYHYVLRDDGPTGDLGYPCSLEMPDGSLFTVYYQKPATAEDKCALLWSRWEMP